MSSLEVVACAGKVATPIDTVAEIGSLEVSTSKLRLAHGFADALGSHLGPGLVEIREEERELLAAEPCGEVLVADVLAENARDADEHDVTREVAVAVVDLPQKVQIRDEERHRSTAPLRALEGLLEYVREVACVVELGLRILPRLCLELRKRQRALNEHERREGECDEPRIVDPDRRDDDADQRDHEIGGDALDREEAALAEGVTAGEPEHDRQQDMVDGDEAHRRGEAR